MNGSSYSPTQRSGNVYAAWALLKYTYGIVAIVAGLDKFFDFLVPWSKYFNPSLIGMLPLTTTSAMYAIGIIEIVAGILVLLRTKVGAYVVCLWLLLISLNLISIGMYYDIAVRDTVMAISAFALALLCNDTDRK